MSDERKPAYTVTMPPNMLVEIDGRVIDQIILEAAHCSATASEKAANRVLLYIKSQIEKGNPVQ